TKTTNVVALAAGEHVLGLTSTGSVITLFGGCDDRGATTIPATLNPALSIAAGWSNSLALTLWPRAIANNYTVYGGVNQDLVISLGGTNVDPYPLNFRIT